MNCFSPTTGNVMSMQPSRKTKILFLTFGIFGLAMAIAVNM